MRVFAWGTVKEEILSVPGGQAALVRLLMGRLKSTNHFYKKMRNNLSRIKLNVKDRLYLETIEVEDGKAYLALEVLKPKHKYDGAKFSDDKVREAFLKQGVAGIPGGVQEIVLEEIEASAAPTAEEEVLEEDDIRQVVSWDGKHFELNLDQEAAIYVKTPALITGAPGAGKSVVALHIAERLAAELEEGDEQKILYVTRSERLARKMEGRWVAAGGLELAGGSAVFFMTDEELLEDVAPDAERSKLKRVGSEEFSTWWIARCKDKDEQAKRWAKRWREEPVGQIYQEFRILTGHTKEEYLKTGRKQSLYLNQDDKTSLWEAYEAYLSFLKATQSIDLSFYQPKLEADVEGVARKKYALIVDEGQDYSDQQWNNFCEISDGNLIGLMDPNQSLEDTISQWDYVVKCLYHKKISQVAQHQLPGSYRCSQQVLLAAEAIFKAGNQVTGGLAHKMQAKLVVESLEDAKEKGKVSFAHPEKDLAWCQERAQSSDVIVITHEAHLDEAQKLFGQERVLTIKQAKGLEWPTVIAYRPFDDGSKIYREINELISTSPEIALKVNRAKDGVGDPTFGPPMQRIFTCFTRAEQDLIIYQQFDRSLSNFQEFLTKAIAQNALEEITVRSKQSVEQTIIKLWESNNDDQAYQFFVNNVNPKGNHEAFEQFLLEQGIVLERRRMKLDSPASTVEQLQVGHFKTVEVLDEDYLRKLWDEKNFTEENLKTFLENKKYKRFLTNRLDNSITFYENIIKNEKMRNVLSAVLKQAGYQEQAKFFLISMQLPICSAEEYGLWCELLENNPKLVVDFDEKIWNKLLEYTSGRSHVDLPLVALRATKVGKKVLEQILANASIASEKSAKKEASDAIALKSKPSSSASSKTSSPVSPPVTPTSLGWTEAQYNYVCDLLKPEKFTLASIKNLLDSKKWSLFLSILVSNKTVYENIIADESKRNIFLQVLSAPAYLEKCEGFFAERLCSKDFSEQEYDLCLAVLNHNPQLAIHFDVNQWNKILPQPRGSRAGQLPLLALCAQGGAGRSIIKQRLKDKPNLLSVKQLAAESPDTCYKQQKMPLIFALLHMASNEDELFDALLYNISEVWAELGNETLCRVLTAQLGGVKGFSVLHLFSGVMEATIRKEILKNLLQTKPRLYDVITSDVLCTPLPAEAKEQANVSVLSILSASEFGRSILKDLFAHNFKLTKQIPEKLLRQYDLHAIITTVRNDTLAKMLSDETFTKENFKRFLDHPNFKEFLNASFNQTTLYCNIVMSDHKKRVCLEVLSDLTYLDRMEDFLLERLRSDFFLPQEYDFCILALNNNLALSAQFDEARWNKILPDPTGPHAGDLPLLALSATEAGKQILKQRFAADGMLARKITLKQLLTECTERQYRHRKMPIIFVLIDLLKADCLDFQQALMDSHPTLLTELYEATLVGKLIDKDAERILILSVLSQAQPQLAEDPVEISAPPLPIVPQFADSQSAAATVKPESLKQDTKDLSAKQSPSLQPM